MKLASLKEGRDGRLIVVSRDLTRAAEAQGIAATMQEALDNWVAKEPQLRALYEKLNGGGAGGFDLDVSELASPLPRAYQWADGSA